MRNTEEAEKAARGGHAEEGPRGIPASGKGLGKGVWGLIEESELAKSIRMGDGVQVKVGVCCPLFSFFAFAGCTDVRFFFW